MPVHVPYRPDLPEVFVGRSAVDAGLLTQAQLRGPLVARVVQGVYRPRWVPPSHLLSCRAAALVLPDGAAITGRSAVTVRGLQAASARDPVEVCSPDGIVVHRRKGLLVRQSSAGIGPVESCDGMPLAGALRTSFDLAARLPRDWAVAHLDAVARAGLIDLDEFQHWLTTRRESNVRHVRRVAALVDPRAESMPESRTRVLLREAGLDVWPQYEVRHLGRFIARVDLALVPERVAVEYDGAWHALREQLSRDRERANLLAQAGWRVVHVTSPMLADPRRLVATVQAVAAQASS